MIFVTEKSCSENRARFLHFVSASSNFGRNDAVPRQKKELYIIHCSILEYRDDILELGILESASHLHELYIELFVEILGFLIPDEVDNSTFPIDCTAWTCERLLMLIDIVSDLIDTRQESPKLAELIFQ